MEQQLQSKIKAFYDETFLRGADITECFKKEYDFAPLSECEFVVITSIDNQLSLLKNELRDFIRMVRAKNKRIIFFGQGDVELGYIPETVGINFKNNLFRSVKKANEYSLTSLAPDRTPKVEFTPCNSVTIGFCGATDRFDRKYYLDVLQKGRFKTSFVIRNGPKWGTDSYKDCINEQNLTEVQNKSVAEFTSNVLDNLFTLCVRGWGNYSYRFCQTICLGRIPILVDTDCVLPYENIFDYASNIVVVKPGEDVNQQINQFVDSRAGDLTTIQQNLYNFGNAFLTPEGFFRNIKKAFN